MPWRCFLWLLVPVAGLVELAAHQFFATRAPTMDEWRELAPAVRELRRHHELVVISPQWAEPNARAALGDTLMPLAHVARADVTAFERAIEIVALTTGAPEVTQWPVTEQHRHGPFLLRLRQNPAPARVTFSFIDAIAQAEVFDEHHGERKPCRWTETARRAAGGLHGHPAYPARRHDCQGGEHHFVGITVVEDQQWKPRRCIWAHPLDRQILTIRFEDVPLGASIRGYAALPWWTERTLRGRPVAMDILVANKKIGSYVHHDGDGWKAFSFRTERAGQRADVEFRVSTSDAANRQFCFTADSR